MSSTEWDNDHPWERQPLDTDLSWPLFQDYLLQQDRPRSLKPLIRHGAMNWGQLQEIEWAHAWKERAGLWDEFIQRARQATVLTDAGISCRIRDKMQRLVEQELDRLTRVSDKSNDLGAVRPGELARFAEVAFKIDRLLTGQPTERVEAGVDLTSLSIEELRALRRMSQKTGVQ